jgi:DNA-directed RNA polymerase subunit F
MEDIGRTERLKELLSAIEMFDAQMGALREARKEAEQEARALFEEMSRELGTEQFTTGTYRVRYAREVVVLNAERLHEMYPDLVEVAVTTTYKPDKSRLRVLLESPGAQQLADIARIERQVVIERDTRKTAKDLAK